MAKQSAVAVTQNFGKLVKQCSSGLQRQSLSPVKSRVVVRDGFPFNSYNPRAAITARGLMSMFEWVRATSFFNFNPGESKYFLDFSELDNYLFFMTRTKLEVSPLIYEAELRKSPITVDMKMSHFGRTSLKLSCEMCFPEVVEPLVHQEISIVFVNPDTRRAEEPPEWWREKFIPHIEPGDQALRLPELDTSLNNKAVEMEYKVEPSDLDPYCHLSASNFIHICMEAYTQWHLQTYGYFDRGDPFRNLTYMGQTYLGEAKAGDVLTVQFWPDSDDENVFNFVILNGGKAISTTVAYLLPSTT